MASARNTFAHGGGVGDFSGRQNRKYPFIKKKNQILSLVTGQENRLCKEKIKRQRNQNQNLTSMRKARRKSEIEQQSCDWLFSRGLVDPRSKILKEQGKNNCGSLKKFPSVILHQCDPFSFAFVLQALVCRQLSQSLFPVFSVVCIDVFLCRESENIPKTRDDQQYYICCSNARFWTSFLRLMTNVAHESGFTFLKCKHQKNL